MPGDHRLRLDDEERESPAVKAKPTGVGHKGADEGDGLDWNAAGPKVGVIARVSRLAERREIGNNLGEK
jgi:hypothetical protein